MPFPVRSFIGPHTKTGLNAHGPISGMGLCQFRHGALPVPVQSFTGSHTETGLYARWVRPSVGLWVCGFVGLWVCGFVGLWLVCAHFERHNDPITNLTFM